MGGDDWNVAFAAVRSAATVCSCETGIVTRRAKTTPSPDANAIPWWLDLGEEDCPHCEQPYSYHAEVRCLECDAPICPMCVVHIHEHAVCPDCRPTGEGT